MRLATIQNFVNRIVIGHVTKKNAESIFDALICFQAGEHAFLKSVELGVKVAFLGSGNWRTQKLLGKLV